MNWIPTPCQTECRIPETKVLKIKIEHPEPQGVSHQLDYTLESLGDFSGVQVILHIN